MGPTILFTHLKIILLQCFQFLVNKRYPNTSLKECEIYLRLKGVFLCLLKKKKTERECFFEYIPRVCGSTSHTH